MPLNTAPHEWTIGSLMDHIKNGPHSELPFGAGWQPARPFGLYSLKSRLRLAWAVFTGRADALFWPGQMPKAY